MTKEIPVGALVAFSTGCYSDYRVGPFGKVLKTINEEVWEEMRAGCTKVPEYHKDADPRFDLYGAAQWFITNGYVEEVEYTELHIGEYSQCNSWADA